MATDDIPRPSYDTTGETSHDRRVHRLTVSEAADALGISRSAVRKRVERGTLQADKDEDGRLHIYVDTRDIGRETHRDTSHKPSSPAREERRDELVEEMRERIESMERQLERAEERDRENRRIIAALTQRIPELEPPRDTSSEARERPVSDEEGAPYGTPPQEAEEALHHAPYDTSPREAEESLQARPRSWWQRWFGG
jgi:excisionase family DNA binding protein